jgi:uncharacterized membrane protein YdbT with pleckstrin-like domain
MNPQQSEQTIPVQTQQSSGPQPIFNLKRHPIGILAVYFGAATMLIVLAVIAFGIVPNSVTSMRASQLYSLTAVGFSIFTILVLGFAYISHLIYWSNKWQLYSDSLTQITRTGLFDKQSSHLSLGNIQDVSSTQNGILPHILNYGQLRVETAGENSRFQFNFCPNPEYYSRQILDARELFMQQHIISINNNGVNATYAPQPPVQQVPTPPAPETEQTPPLDPNL